MIPSNAAELAVGVLILGNAAMIGLQAQSSAGEPTKEDLRTFRAFSTFFCWIFVAELLMRIAASGRAFLRGPGWLWNLLDFFIVGFSMLDEIISYTVDDSSSPSGSSSTITLLRLARISKLARVLRIVRVVRVFRELRVILHSIASGFYTMGWTLLLLLIILYVCGAFFTQTIATDDNASEVLKSDFGSLPMSMLTLLGIVTGNGWKALSDELVETNLFALAILTSYVCFVTFALLNIMTGFFVEEAVKSAEADFDNVISEHQGERKRIADNLRNMFDEADVDNSGTMTWNELLDHLENPTVQAYFHTLQLDLNDLEAFFRLGDEIEPQVSCDQFVKGCMRLRGTARNVDMAALRHEVEVLTTETRSLYRIIKHLPEVKQLAEGNSP